MAAFKKGQEYRPPYDQGLDAESKAGVGLDRDSYYPSRKPNVYTADSPPKGNAFDNCLDLSGTIDPQAPYGHGFDNVGKSGDWRSTNSDSGLGGFAGKMPKSSSHPKAGIAGGKKTS
jgi:hypothetical protein